MLDMEEVVDVTESRAAGLLIPTFAMRTGSKVRLAYCCRECWSDGGLLTLWYTFLTDERMEWIC